MAVTKRPNRLLDKIIKQSSFRARKDINAWRTALTRAENVETPRRDLLLNVYDEIMLDAHLSAEIQKRTLAVTGATYHLYNADGTINDNSTLIETSWFIDFLRMAMDSIWYGHSLIQIEGIVAGEIQKLTLINRRHVVPEQGLFLIRPTDEKGIAYREDKKYALWLIEVGDTHNLGLLNKAVPHVLYKRFAQSAWSEFSEIFGMPIRYGKTNTKDVESLNRMEQMMQEMGAAAYAVIDNDEQIEFVESNKSNGDVYNGLINRCNSEVSKLINGAVIGEASQGGSRAKEQVGADIGNSIYAADKQFIENYINTTLIPKLIQLGYPIQGTYFAFEQTKDTNQLWQITQGILNHYDVDEQFITDTFGIPVTGKKQPPSGSLKADTDFFD